MCMCLMFQSIFFFALTWSIGGSCADDGRVKFDKLIKELMSVRFEPTFFHCAEYLGPVQSEWCALD